jgi:hypothetical protein
MRLRTLRGTVLLAGLVIAPAYAQSPPFPAPPTASVPAEIAAPALPASSEAAEIASCLCQQLALDRLNADMTAQRQTLAQLRSELDRIDADLQRERATVDIDNPQAVAQFSEKLAARDALFRRSTGPAANNLGAATARYNAAVGRYNSECANRPRDPALLAQVQQTLSCPAPP